MSDVTHRHTGKAIRETQRHSNILLPLLYQLAHSPSRLKVCSSCGLLVKGKMQNNIPWEALSPFDGECFATPLKASVSVGFSIVATMPHQELCKPQVSQFLKSTATHSATAITQSHAVSPDCPWWVVDNARRFAGDSKQKFLTSSKMPFCKKPQLPPSHWLWLLAHG